MVAVAEIGSDPDAFEVFYREHVDRVQRFVARRVADPQLVADLTAEVFLAAIDSAASYRPERGSPAGWLFGVARNVVSSEHRRWAREYRATQQISGRRLLDTDDIARLLDKIDAESGGRELLRAMRDLPPSERAVIELVALDGITVQDAAQVLGIRPATARVRLHRARARLRSPSSSPPRIETAPEVIS